jgi:hypothetical protein
MAAIVKSTIMAYAGNTIGSFQHRHDCHPPFGNSSGGAITIREIGLVTCQWVRSSDNHYDYLIARDAVNQTVNAWRNSSILWHI